MHYFQILKFYKSDPYTIKVLLISNIIILPIIGCFMISRCFYIYFYIFCTLVHFVPMTCHLVAATGSICTCNMTLKQAKLVLLYACTCKPILNTILSL